MLFRSPLITTAWVFLFLFHLGLSTAKSVVVISEFLADNVDGLVDEDGDHSDWIEVTDMGSAAENLSGWRLTDTRSSPSKWIFPAGVRLPAAGRLIVFASGKNRSRAGSPLHANFSLRKEGEYLALFPPGASIPTTAFAPVFPPQQADVSYGTGFRTSGPSSVGDGSPARIRIPSASDTGPGWRGAFQTEPFDDSGWIQGGVRVGYDDLTEVAAGQLLGY